MRRVYALAALLLFALVACSDGGSNGLGLDGLDAATREAVIANLDPDEYERAYRGYESSFHEANELCMRQRGFRLPPKRPSRFDSQQIEPQTGDVEVYGFGFIAPMGDMDFYDGQPEESNKDFDAYFKALLSAEKDVYWEAHAACADESAVVANPLLPQSYELTDSEQALLARAQERAEADPELAVARGRWSKCMAESGFPGLTPETLVSAGLGPDFQQEATTLVLKWQQAVGLALSEDTQIPTPAEVLSSAELSQARALQDLEIALATTHLACSDGLALRSQEILLRQLRSLD